MRIGILVMCLSAMSSIAAAQEIDGDLLSRIHREAPEGWARCETAFQDMACSVQFSQSQHGKATSDTRKYEISSALNRSELLIITRDDKSNQEQSRTVINSRYHFSVNAISGGDSWSLSNGAPSAMSITPANTVRALKSDALTMLNSVAILGLPLREFFNDSEQFRLLSCKTINDKGTGSLVQCVFDCRSHYPQFSSHRLLVELLPAESWIIHRWSKTNLQRGIKNDMTHELQRAPNGAPCLKKASLVRGSAQDGDTTIIEFGEPVLNSRRSEEFYLPFYGISEASVMPPPATKDWLRYVMFFFGIALVLGGLYLRRKREGRT